jgi:RsiW-degrading membrane proteinase PrsW (M82 family)
MASNKTAIRTMSRWSLVWRFGVAGAFAGFAAWAVVLAAHMLFGVSRPSGISLLLAMPRGALFGIILALILHFFWNRPSGRNQSKGRL